MDMLTDLEPVDANCGARSRFLAAFDLATHETTLRTMAGHCTGSAWRPSVFGSRILKANIDDDA